MTDLRVHRFRGPHGAELAWREIGDGTPLVLLHGLMGSGALMASDGPARAIAERGYRVILNGRLAVVPGDHVTAPSAPEFTDAVANFLG